MAAKKTAARRPSPRTARTTTRGARPPHAPSSPDDRILDAALDEAAAVGWTNVTIDGVAERADIALGEVLLHYPTRIQILARLLQRLDERLLASVKGIDPADSARDRLFDVLMRRFDLLERHREGARAVIRGLWREPAAGVVLACRVERSCAMLLGAAGISAEGLRGWLRIQGLKAVLGFALRAWMNDDTEDMAKTMAALDRALDRAERLASFANVRRRRAPASAD